MKEKTKKRIKAAALSASTALIGGAAASTVAFADNDFDTGLNTAMLSVLNIVGNIFRWIGVVLMVWGVGQLVLAFKNDDADSKSRGAMVVVAGFAATFIKTIMNLILGNAGGNTTVNVSPGGGAGG